MSRVVRFLSGIGIAALVAVLFLLSYKVGERRGKTEAQSLIIRDTTVLSRVDTISVPQPIFITKETIDTMLVPVYIPMRDTVFIPIPREQAYYKDETYEAWVSGYKPALDSINVYRRLETITIFTEKEVKVQSHWGLGISAGYGMGKDGLSPYIGVGISYNLLSF